MHRRIVPFAFATLFTLGLGIGLAQADDPKPCNAKSFKLPAVESACKTGGQPAAKKLMKKAVDKAKAAGEDMNCKTCHNDLKTFDLKDGAVEGLAKWL